MNLVINDGVKLFKREQNPSILKKNPQLILNSIGIETTIYYIYDKYVPRQ